MGSNNDQIILVSDDDDDVGEEKTDFNKVYGTPKEKRDRGTKIRMDFVDEDDDENEEDKSEIVTKFIPETKSKKPTTNKKRTKDDTTTTTSRNKTSITNTKSNTTTTTTTTTTINKKQRVEQQQEQEIVIGDSEEEEEEEQKPKRTTKKSSSQLSPKETYTKSKRKSNKNNSDESDNNSNSSGNKKKKTINNEEVHDILNDTSFSFLAPNNNSSTTSYTSVNVSTSVNYDEGNYDDESFDDEDLIEKSFKPESVKPAKGGRGKSTSETTKTTRKTTKSKKQPKQPKAKKITKETCLAETFIVFDKNLRNDIGMDDIERQLRSPQYQIENIEYSDERDSTNNVNNNNNNNNNNYDDDIVITSDTTPPPPPNIPYSITFLRKNQQINNQTYEIYDDFIILKYPTRLLVDLIAKSDLLRKIARLKLDYPNYKFVLLIEALDAHLQQLSKGVNTKQLIKNSGIGSGSNIVDSVASSSLRAPPNRNAINILLTQIQIEHSITIRVIEQRNDVINFISKCYRTIALLPLRNDEQLFEGFCAESIKKKNSKQKTLTDIWADQLCQINGISLNIARGIINEFPTFTVLVSWFGNNNDINTALDRLKNIKIDTNNGKTKNLGPVLSNKIHQIFSSKDYNKVVY